MPTSFLTRAGAQLREDGAEYKANIANISWLGLGYRHWQRVSDAYFPQSWQVDDAYAQCQVLGVNMVRGYSLMPTFGGARTVFPTPMTPNPEAFRAIDYAIARAADYGLRLMIPLCDPYGYYVGGTNRGTFQPAAAGSEYIQDWSLFLGGSSNDFHSNNSVWNQWKDHVTLFVQHRNLYNGLRYCDDPTIAIWETGNELPAPWYWTGDICAHLKGIAPQQLTKDGSDLSPIPAQSLTDPNIDIVGDHFYPLSVARLQSDLAGVAGSGKCFLIAEYDWNNNRGGDAMIPTFRDAILANAAAIAGQGWWALSGHAGTSGWNPSAQNYVGQDGLPYDVQFGNPANQSKIEALRSLGYAFRGLAEPAWPVPATPPVRAAGSRISWTGVPGASRYTIQRETSPGVYATHLDNLWDGSGPQSLPAGRYRVVAANPAGVAGSPSAPLDIA